MTLPPPGLRRNGAQNLIYFRIQACNVDGKEEMQTQITGTALLYARVLEDETEAPC